MKQSIGILLAVMLIIACINPVAALDTTARGDVWVKDSSCDSGNSLGACAFAPFAIAAVPYLAAEAGEKVYVLYATGGAIMGFVAVSRVSHDNPAPEANSIDFTKIVSDGLKRLDIQKQLVWTGAFEQNSLEIYKPGSIEYNRLNKINDYNDAKEKGVPVPGKNKDESTANRLDSVGMPYSSQRLFRDGTDEKNGCPKQIRYYGKDGKAEEDIDFYGPTEPAGFPHRHGWKHDLIAQGITDRELYRPYIDFGAKFLEWFKKSPCKGYDFKTHTFKKGGL